MDIITKITLPNEVYQFYASASSHISQHTPEDVMADALSAYARILRGGSKDTDPEGESGIK